MAKDRRSQIRAAEKLVARGKLEAAIKQYRKVLRATPDDTGTLNRVGDLYARLDRLDEAVEIFTQAADHFVAEGFLVKAIAILKKIIRLDPTRISVYETLADLYHRQGLRNEARSQYQVVADYHLQSGDTNRVRSIYERMIELEPNNPSHRVKLAELYCESSMIPEAMDQYQKIAAFMLDHGRVDDALSVYRGAVDLSPSDLGFLTDVVLHLKDQAQTQAAEQLLAEAIRKNPEAERVREVTGFGEGAPGEPLLTVPEAEAPTAEAEEAGEKEREVSEALETAEAGPAEVGGALEDAVEDAPQATAVDELAESGEITAEEAEAVDPETQLVDAMPDADSAVGDTTDEEFVVLDLDSGASDLPFAVDEQRPQGIAEEERPEGPVAEEVEIDLDELEVAVEPQAEDAELVEAAAEAEHPAVTDTGFKDGIGMDAELEVEKEARAEAGDQMDELIQEVVGTGADDGEEVLEEVAATGSEEHVEILEDTEAPVSLESVLDEMAQQLETEKRAVVEPEAAESEPVVESSEPVQAAEETDVVGLDVAEVDAEAGVEDLLSEARMLASYGLAGKAASLCRRAVELDPNRLEAHDLLVGLLHDAGDEVAAAAAATEARDAVGTDLEGWGEVSARLEDLGYQVTESAIGPPMKVEALSEPAEELVGEQLVDEIASEAVRDAVAEPTVEAARGEDAVGDRDAEGLDWLAEPSGEQSFAEADEIFGAEEEFFDLAAELEEELEREDEEYSGEFLPQLQEQSLEEIVEGFKKGVSETLSDEDYETHYNLGIAYREMGLIDEAIGEFQLAAKAPDYLVDCCSLLGSCFVEKGFPDLAIKWFERGLEAPRVTESESLGLLYELGNLYLITGDKDVARKTFAEIYGVNSNYRDVVAKLEELRST